jgi:predicted Zn-dependent protease
MIFRPLLGCLLLLGPGEGCSAAQMPPVAPWLGEPIQTQPVQEQGSAADISTLQQGIALTRSGRFAEAIPLLKKADTQGIAGYAGRYDLALCYLATGDTVAAEKQTDGLLNEGHATAQVYNLKAQILIAERRLPEAWTAIRTASSLTPADEKLYAFLLDACADHHEPSLALQTADLGLSSLPHSQRLHYERALALARLDRLDEARPEFTHATELGPDTWLGRLAQIQSRLYDNDLPGALVAARAAVEHGQHDPDTLALFGTVLLYEGASPGEPRFEEAQHALEAAVAAKPLLSSAQIALGKVYLMQGRPRDAITHLEVGRRLEPQNTTVYAQLSTAYRQVGDRASAAECSRQLAALLKDKSASAK